MAKGYSRKCSESLLSAYFTWQDLQVYVHFNIFSNNNFIGKIIRKESKYAHACKLKNLSEESKGYNIS